MMNAEDDCHSPSPISAHASEKVTSNEITRRRLLGHYATIVLFTTLIGIQYHRSYHTTHSLIVLGRAAWPSSDGSWTHTPCMTMWAEGASAPNHLATRPTYILQSYGLGHFQKVIAQDLFELKPLHASMCIFKNHNDLHLLLAIPGIKSFLFLFYFGQILVLIS